MHTAVIAPDEYLTEIASHLIVAGGKRLRPVLSTVAAQIVGAAASDDVVRGGVSCELVHLGSLYHDDVMDEADTRRGVETVNAKWGNLQAILAGDFLLSRASEIAASLGTEVAGLLARTIGWLCEGQIEELRFTYDVGSDRRQLLRLDPRQDGVAVRHGCADRWHRRRPRPGRRSTRSPTSATPTAWCSRSSTTSSMPPPPTNSSESRPVTTWSKVCTHCRCCAPWRWARSAGDELDRAARRATRCRTTAACPGDRAIERRGGVGRRNRRGVRRPGHLRV